MKPKKQTNKPTIGPDCSLRNRRLLMRQSNNFKLNVYQVVNLKERYTFWIHGSELFFRLNGKMWLCGRIISPTSAGRDFDTTIKCNASKGEEFDTGVACQQPLLFGRVKGVSREREAHFVCPNKRACSQANTGVALDAKLACLAPSSLFSRDQQGRVGSLFRIVHYCWIIHYCWMPEKKKTWRKVWSISSHLHLIEQSNT